MNTLQHIKAGKKYKIPYCCIARWIVHDHWFNKKAAVNLGIKFNKHNFGVFVPCNIFHKPDASWEQSMINNQQKYLIKWSPYD